MYRKDRTVFDSLLLIYDFVCLGTSVNGFVESGSTNGTKWICYRLFFSLRFVIMRLWVGACNDWVVGLFSLYYVSVCRRLVLFLRTFWFQRSCLSDVWTSYLGSPFSNKKNKTQKTARNKAQLCNFTENAQKKNGRRWPRGDSLYLVHFIRYIRLAI